MSPSESERLKKAQADYAAALEGYRRNGAVKPPPTLEEQQELYRKSLEGYKRNMDRDGK